MRKIKVSAPGKIILSGEHSVVYGQPAIVTALDKRLFVEVEEGKGKTEISTDEDPNLAYYALLKTEEFLEKKLSVLRIKIHSEIPVKRGMGSSAALAVAMVVGLFSYSGKDWDKNLINQIAYRIEKKQHGKPSGCDNSIATFGGTIVFKKGKIRPLAINPDFDFILLDSGRAVESTGEMVAMVKGKFNYLKTQKIVKKIGKVTVELIKELEKRHFNYLKLKFLISENEKLLEELGVVSKKAKEIIREIEKNGGAAKICGAGGIRAGSGIILGLHKNLEKLKEFLQSQNLKFFETKIHQEGVRIERN